MRRGKSLALPLLFVKDQRHPARRRAMYMIRSFAFTTQGRLHTRNVEMFLMPEVLTLITLITTPVTLVGTWYGMNFQHMPEYRWKYGYEMAFVITASSTALVYWWFKRKRWF